jgi:gas vesicle protein
MRVKRFVVPAAAALAWSKLLSDDQRDNIRKSVKDKLPDNVGPLLVVNRRRGRRRTLTTLSVGAVVGGLIAYFFDPEQGRVRRAKARDMSAARARRAQDSARKMRVRTENKAQGIQAGLRPKFDTGSDFNDPTLAQKIQSEVLRDFPTEKININVEDGRVVLRGVLERPEQIKALEAAVRKVPGVVEVDNLTHLSGSAAPKR